MRVVCICFENTSLTNWLQEFAETCLRLTPYIACSQSPERPLLFLEIGSCKKLYSEKIFLLKLEILLKRFSLRAKVAIAENASTAAAMTIFNVTEKNKLPIEALNIFYDPFFFEENKMALQKEIALIKKLGVQKISEIQKQNRKLFTKRFGKSLLFALGVYEGFQEIQWPLFRLSEKIYEEQSIDDSYVVQNFENLNFPIKIVLDRIVSRLRGRGMSLSVFRLKIVHEKFSTVKETERTWTFQLTFPQTSVLMLHALIRERLSLDLQLQQLEAPVCKIAVDALEFVPSAATQKDFFSKKEEETEKIQSLISRMSEKIGSTSVFCAIPVQSYLPEESWKKSVDMTCFDKENSFELFRNHLPQRPLRMLSKPKKIQKIDDWICSENKKWRIQKIQGVEKIFTEWWFEKKEREYQFIVTFTQENLWIYQDKETNQYYLHGIFD